MNDPFAKYSKYGGGGGSVSSSTHGITDPFAKYAHMAAPRQQAKPKQQQSFIGKVTSQAQRTWGNIKKDFSDWETAVNNTALNKKVASGHKNQVTAKDWVEGWNQAIGKPAGYVAMTPGVIAPVRAAAGLMAAPMIASDVANTYQQAKQANRASGGTPARANASALAQTARAFTYGPIVEAGKKWISNPAGTAQEILDNPLNIYNDVFIPASIAEGGYKGAKSIGKSVLNRNPNLQANVNRVFDPIREKAAAIKDPLAKYSAKSEPEVDTMREPEVDTRREPVAREPMREPTLEVARAPVEIRSPINDNTISDPFAKYAAKEPEIKASTSKSEIPANRQNIGQLMYDRYIQKHHYTPSQASAMVGNAGQESSFNTEVISKDGHNSYGLFQFTGPRRTAYLKFARENHIDPNDWRAQVDFSDYELHTTESRAWREMNLNPNASPEDMALTVSTYYERPKAKYANNSRRQKIAREVYDGKGGGPVTDGTAYNDNYQAATAGDDAVLRIFDKDSKPANLNVFDDSNVRTNSAESDVLSSSDAAAKARKQNANVFDENQDRTANDVPDDTITNIQPDTTEPFARTNNVEDLQRLSDMSDMDGRINQLTKRNPRDNTAIRNTDNTIPGYDSDTIGRVTRLDENRANQAIDRIAQKNTLPRAKMRYNTPDIAGNRAAEPTPILTDARNNAGTFRDVNDVNNTIYTQSTPNQMAVNTVNPVESIRFQRNPENVRLRDSTAPVDVNANTIPRYDDMAQRYSDTAQNEPVYTAPENVQTNAEPDYTSIQPDMTSTARQNAVVSSPTTDIQFNEVTQGEPVSRRDILDTINREFNVRIKQGRLNSPSNVQGWFNRRTKAIRTREFMDPRTVTHELGHYIDDKFNFSGNPSYNDEFIPQVKKRFGRAYDNLPTDGIRAEGFAEFFRDYTSNRERAKTAFPRFYNDFERMLSRDPELKTATNKLSAIVHQWNRQAPDDRVGGRIAWEPRDTEQGGIAARIKRVASKAYTQMIDELNPIEGIVKEVEKRTGQKMAKEANPFLQAWAARGWAGKAQAMLEHGVPEEGVKSLTDIYKYVGEGREKAFAEYLVAQREHDIWLWNRQMLAQGKRDQLITRTISDEEMNFTLDKYGEDTKIAQAAADLYQYEDYMLRKLRETGFLSNAGYVAMSDKYPHYIPFLRDFSDSAATEFASMANNGFVNIPNPVKKMKGSTRDIINPLESVIKNTILFTKVIEKNEVGKRIAAIADIPGMGDLIEEVSGSASPKDSTFSIWKDGQKVSYATTPDVYKAVQMYNPETANIVVNIMSKPASWLRFGATISPEFTAGNIVRDTISATVFSHHGFIPLYDSIRGLFHYLKKDNVYWDYMNSGGAQADIMSIDRNFLHDQTRKMLGRNSTVKNVIKSPITCLRALSECSEMATRLGEFENARHGYTGLFNRLFSNKHENVSLRDAGIASRDVTLDFGRHGIWGKQFNRATAFFNAALQGTDKLYREVKAHPAQMAFKTAALITLPSIASWYACKDDPRYQEVPQWEKDIYWFIPTKNALYKVPKPYELGVMFGSGIERALQYQYDQARNIDGNGFNGFGEIVLDTIGPSFLPTGLIPIFEWQANYNYFQNKAIVPQSQKNLPNWMQYGNGTSYVARQLGKAFDLSPRKIDNTVYDLTGGFGRHVLGIVDDATGLSKTRPAVGLSGTAFAKKFIETPYKNADSVSVLQDRYNEQEKLFNEYKQTGQMPEGFNPERYSVYKNTMDAISNVNKAEMAVINSKDLSSQEKKQRLNELNMMSVKLSRRALNKEVDDEGY